MTDIKKVTFFMEECKRMGVPVLGPDVNESAHRFTVNEEGAIRFGLGGMKGIGENAVYNLIEERKANGKFNNIFNVVERVDSRIVNKRTLEGLAYGGAFDSFENEHRAVYFVEEGDGRTFLEKVMKYAQNKKNADESSQVSLFGESSGVELPEPPLPDAPRWPRMVALRKEKEVNGMYLSSHPLDEFKHEIKYFVKNSLTDLANIENMVGQEVTFAAIVTTVQHRVAQNGNGWGVFKIEDYSGDYEFRLFKESYLKFKHMLDMEQMIFIKARVQERFRNFGDRKEKEVNLDIKEVMLLSSLFSEINAAAEIKVSLEHIDDVLVEDLLRVIKKHKGSSRLRLKVRYASESLEIGLLPKSVKVDITKQFVDDILKIKHLKLNLNY